MRTLRLACVLFVAGASAMATVARAEDLSPSDIRGKSSKEPVTVLQNRAFLKAYRPEVGLVAGAILDEAYTNTTLTGMRAGMFVNEWLGFEVDQFQTKVADSADRKALDTLKYRPLNDPGAGNATSANGTTTTTTTVVSPDPEVNAIHQITDFSAVAAPLYGKINILNKWIIYTDLYGTGGVSRIVTDQGPKLGETVGAGERFYLGKAWSVRVDFKDRIFNEERAGAQSRRNSKAVDFGASYFFK